MSLFLVLLGGAVGAPVRYLVDRAVMRGRSGAMPWGTLAVNVIGSFVLGLVVGVTSVIPAAAQAAYAGLTADQWRLLLGTGLCGALTTYSTFGFENVRLLQEGRVQLAMVNIGGTLAATCAAVAAGLALASAVV